MAYKIITILFFIFMAFMLCFLYREQKRLTKKYNRFLDKWYALNISMMATMLLYHPKLRKKVFETKKKRSSK